MSTYNQIASAIDQRLAAVSGVGRVHLYQRNARTPEKFKALFFDPSQGRVSAWTISRESWSDTQSANTANTRVSTWVLRGYMATDDDTQTEIIFQQLCDDIADAFRPQGDLDSSIELTRPIQARSIGYSDIGSIQCHTAELAFDVQEYYTS